MFNSNISRDTEKTIKGVNLKKKKSLKILIAT